MPFVRRKRKRFQGFGSRKRRTRRFRRSRANSSFTSQKGTGTQFRFGGRKLSRRRWMNSLYTTTRHLPHYRSTSQESNTVSTAINATLYKTWFLPALSFAGNFWTQAGGFQPLDNGGINDLAFQGDVVVRGGSVGIHIHLPYPGGEFQADRILAYCALVKVRKGTMVSTWTAGTTVGIGWEPSLIPDFGAQFGKVIYSAKQFIAMGDTWSITRKIGIEKMDQEIHTDTYSYQWFVGFNDPNGAGLQVKLVRYFNLSFTGDATVKQF